MKTGKIKRNQMFNEVMSIMENAEPQIFFQVHTNLITVSNRATNLWGGVRNAIEKNRVTCSDRQGGKDDRSEFEVLGEKLAVKFLFKQHELFYLFRWRVYSTAKFLWEAGYRRSFERGVEFKKEAHNPIKNGSMLNLAPQVETVCYVIAEMPPYASCKKR